MNDGTVLGFTDHDRDLVIAGTTYKAASGFTATAIGDRLGLAVSNLDVDGALSSAAPPRTISTPVFMTTLPSRSCG